MLSFKDIELTDNLIYFTYGSNMSNEIQKWREITYTKKFNAILLNHKLNFDLQAYPLVEGGWANIKEENGNSIHGVAIEMTKINFLKKVKELESPQYEIKEIEIISYDQKNYNAITLFVKNSDNIYAYPSRRYLNLIINGAKENKLDEDYILYLEKFPDAVSSLSIFGKIIRLWFFVIFLPCFFMFFLEKNFNKFINPKKLHVILHLVVIIVSFIPKKICNNAPRGFIFKKTKLNPQNLEFLTTSTNES